jgi:signal transduction histidine kinase
MKPGTKGCCRASRAITQVLLAFLLAALPCAHASEPVSRDAALHFTTVEMLEATGPGGPLQPVVDSAALAGRWREVHLPVSFAAELIPGGQAPAMTTRWLRARFPGVNSPGDTTHLYLERTQIAGHIAVYADGKLVYRSLGSPAWTQYRRQALFVPLSFTAQALPPGELLIRVDVLQGTGGGISSFYVGNTGPLLSVYSTQQWWEHHLPMLSGAGSVAMGLFCLVVWIRRRYETLYLLFFLFSATQVLRRWNLHPALERLPLPDVWFGWIVLNAQTWQIVVLHFIMLVLHGTPLPRLTRAIVIFGAAFTVSTVAIHFGQTSELLIRPVLQMLQLALLIVVVGTGLWHAWRRRSPDGILLGGANVVFAVLNLVDWHMAYQRGNVEWVLLNRYVPTILLGIMLFIFFRRYTGAIGQVEQVNAGLADRLESQETELAQSYQRLRAVEHQQMLSTERQRLMQDMHDGLGSSLTSAIRAVDRGKLTDAQVSDVLKGCMDDLKLAVDSMEPVEADLLLLLATLRFRLAPRIADAGVKLHWEVRAVPSLDWLDPSSALHILRIVQECMANVLRHTHATEIHLSTAPAGAGVSVVIDDNGAGFEVEKTLQHGTGRGLRNQMRRAQAIGGSVHWESGPAGTRFTLWLPLQRRAPPT